MLIFGVAAHAAPLIHNGDFEANSGNSTYPNTGASFWYYFPSNQPTSVTTIDLAAQSPIGLPGMQGADLHAVSTDGSAQYSNLHSDNSLTLTSGNYTLTFDNKFLSATAPGIWATFTVKWFDSSDALISSSSGSIAYNWAWATESHSVTAPALTDHATIDFYANASGGAGGDFHMAIDNVALVPEPSALALLGIAGSVFVAFSARRIRKSCGSSAG